MTSDLVISPKIDAKDMVQNMTKYQELVDKLLDDNDSLVLKGKKFLRKSGWQKLAVPFNISTSIVEERKETIPDDPTKIIYHFTVRAEVPNIRSVEDVGSCDNITDRPGSPIHVVRTMAKTRATSRAIASLLGKSEQSAEDIESIPEQQQGFSTSPNPPSEKQIAYLKSLDPNVEIPKTMYEAGVLIERLKNK